MRQGNDIGEQYRSVIFCKDSQQLEAANISKEVFQTKLDEKGFGLITTEIKIETKTFPAEDYHQDYYEKNFIRYLMYKKACKREDTLREIWN